MNKKFLDYNCACRGRKAGLCTISWNSITIVNSGYGEKRSNWKDPGLLGIYSFLGYPGTSDINASGGFNLFISFL